MAATASPDRRARAEREALIESNLPLARRLARRYRHSGESDDDLEQVAYLGLVKAAERYDPDRGPFASYAAPTILGELRRHFRDRGWGVHVTRSIQENVLAVNDAIERLYGELGRTPNPREVAASTGLAIEDVIEAMSASSAYTPAALDAPLSGAEPGDDGSLGDSLGTIDHGYELVELRQSIGPAFRDLPVRDQRIVHLRFVEDLTQSEIAARLGISQMHVSRLLRRALDQLHDAASDREAEAA
jgi:RNA polymerase sigma-B factor